MPSFFFSRSFRLVCLVLHGRLPLGLSASLWRRGLSRGAPPTEGCRAGEEGESLLGSFGPRSPEKGPSGCTLSFSWLGGRGDTPTGGRRGRQSDQLIVRTEREDGKGVQGHLSPSVGLLMSAESCLGAQHACSLMKIKCTHLQAHINIVAAARTPL